MGWRVGDRQNPDRRQDAGPRGADDPTVATPRVPPAPTAPAAPMAVAVVGIGIRGQGIEGTAAFMQRLGRTLGPFRPQPDPRGLSRLAGMAADEAYAGASAWSQDRSILCLGLDEAHAESGTGLLQQLERRFGFQMEGRIASAGELSGNRALATALWQIRAGTVDAALVGAAATWPCPGAMPSGLDGLAVFLALRRRDAALRDGDRIWAVLGPGPERLRGRLRLDPRELLPGRGHAVSGLLQVAAGCIMAAHQVQFNREDRTWEPLLDRTDGCGFVLEVETSWGVGTTVDLWHGFTPGRTAPAWIPAPVLRTFAGASVEDLLQRVQADQRGGTGPARLAVLAANDQECHQALAPIPDRLRQRSHEPGWLDGRTCFSPAPLQGRVASLFTPLGAGYPGMGRELVLGLPPLPRMLRPLAQDLGMAAWIYEPRLDRSGSSARRGDPLHESTASLVLSQLHAAFTRELLGLRPQVAMGLAMGEMSALMAYGVWGGLDTEFERLRRSGVYSHLLAGALAPVREHWQLPESEPLHWRSWSVFGPVARVLERAASETRAHVALVYSPVHCLLSGEAEACRRVLADCRGLTAVPALALAAHTPAMSGAREALFRHFHRPVRMVPDIEFHSGYFAGPYDLSPDRVATALTEQLLAPQDLPTAAWRAWDSGVRIFIEHGPRNLLTCALRRILPRDQGLFLAMDVQGENSLHSAMRVAAELWCRGVPVDLARLETALGRSQAPPAPPPPLLDVAASLFAASLASAGSMRDAYQACLRNTEGRFLEFLDPTSGQNAPHA